MGKQPVSEEDIRKCIEEAEKGPKQAFDENLEACIMNEARRKEALKKIEEANQVIGKWSEETENKMFKRIAPDYIERLDAIGKELKEFKF